MTSGCPVVLKSGWPEPVAWSSLHSKSGLAKTIIFSILVEDSMDEMLTVVAEFNRPYANIAEKSSSNAEKARNFLLVIIKRVIHHQKKIEIINKTDNKSWEINFYVNYGCKKVKIYY